MLSVGAARQPLGIVSSRTYHSRHKNTTDIAVEGCAGSAHYYGSGGAYVRPYGVNVGVVLLLRYATYMRTWTRRRRLT